MSAWWMTARTTARRRFSPRSRAFTSSGTTRTPISPAPSWMECDMPSRRDTIMSSRWTPGCHTIPRTGPVHDRTRRGSCYRHAASRRRDEQEPVPQGAEHLRHTADQRDSRRFEAGGSRWIRDCTSGYRRYSRRAIEQLTAAPLQCRAFDFLLQTLVVLVRNGTSVRRCPLRTTLQGRL